MKSILIARTGNEEDIIEPFIRHHCEHFTSLLIYDDNSVDRTSTIIERLMAEGAPVHLIQAGAVDWPWLDVSTRLMRLAFKDHGADWVAPLDVDEFIELPGEARLKTSLPKSHDGLVQLKWSNFVWSRHETEATDPNPVTRMTDRMSPRPDSLKYIIPSVAFRHDPDLALLEGNHGLITRSGAPLRLLENNSFALCHYPIRSMNQFINKCVAMSLRHQALPHRSPVAAFQYAEPFALIKSERFDDLADFMEKESRRYALAKGRNASEAVERGPLNYLGGRLKYSRGFRPPLTNIVNLAEEFARRLSVLERLHLERSSAPSA